MLIVLGLVAGIGYFVVSSIFSSEVCRHALELARANQEVVGQLGEPIEEGWLPMGSISISGPSGTASSSVPISGPKGSATIYVEVTKSAGRWEYELLDVAFEEGPDRIPLIPAPEASGEPGG